jgi:glycosyltransferase involved in cell wall biosynthesis
MLRFTKSRVFGRDISVFEHAGAIAATFERLHRSAPIDVIEMEESFGFAARVARDCDVPLVVKLHGPAFLHLVEEELNTPFGKEKVLREGEALKMLPVVTAPSRSTLSETMDRYGLHPAVAEQIVNPIAESDGLPLWSLEGCKRNRILFVGRFDKVKGADVLVRAFAELSSTQSDLELVFVGPDPGLLQSDGSRAHLHEFVASLGGSALTQRIFAPGFLPPSEVNALRASALVTVAASRRESQGYVALEAMLQGCPVVCTDSSGLSEIVEHEVTGLKAKPEDAHDMAEQIGRIVADPALGRTLGRAARAYVIEHHAPGAVVARTLDVYRRAIELRRGHGPRRG